MNGWPFNYFEFKLQDTIGESILICSGSNIETGKELISAQLKPIKSCLELDNYVSWYWNKD